MNAEYTTSLLYPGNPYVEALPPMLAGQELIRALASVPLYSTSDRDRSTGERLQLLSALYEFYQPLTMTLDLYCEVYNAMQHCYGQYTPQRETAALQQGYAAMQGKAVAASIGGGNSFSVVGVSGLGKSTALQRVLSLFPQIIHHERYNGQMLCCQQIPYLVVQTPHDGSVKAMILDIYFLGAGLAASRAGKGLDALLVNRCGLGDNTVIPTVGQLGGVLALVGQAGNLVALVNRVALGRAGRRNDLFDMVGFIQLRRFLGAGLAAGLAGVSNCALFKVGGLFRDNARAPVVAVGGNVVVVVVHAAPLLADVFVVARRRAACGVLADDVSVGDGLRRGRGCRCSGLCRCFGRIGRFTGLTAFGAGIIFAAGIAVIGARGRAAIIGAALLALAVGGFCCRFRWGGRGRRGRGCSRCCRSGRRFSLRAGRLALTGGRVGCVRRGF